MSRVVSMSTSKLKLCVICCSAFSSASTVESDAVSCREHLLNFCKLLANSPPRHCAEYETLLQRSFPGMDTFFVDSGMSVCVDCNHQITVAMEKGRDTERKEEEVRLLQRRIVEQMKALERQLEEFHEQMSKVEKVIQLSDVSCLMYHMSKIPNKNEDATNGIVLIRRRILDVMEDLRDFQARQKAALECEATKVLEGDEQGEEPADADDAELDEEDDERYLPYLQPEVILGVEGHAEAGFTPNYFGHTVHTSDGDFRYEAASKVNANEGDSDFSADDESEESEDEVEYIPPKHVSMAVSSAVVPVSVPMSVPVSVPGVSSVPGGLPLPQTQGRAGVPGRTRGPVQAGARNVVGRAVPQVPGRVAPAPVLSTPFKQEFISRAVRREQGRRIEEKTSLDPLIRYTFRHEPESQKLSVNGYEVSVDEQTRSMTCVACGFSRREIKRVGGSLDLEWKMKVHIISTHIGFKCLAPNCTFECSNHPSFLGHLKESHNNNPAKVLPRNNGTLNNSSSSTRTYGPPKVCPSVPPAVPTSGTGSRTRSQTPPSSQKPRPSSSIRTCPVSACRRTFTKKEEFIKHLQEHRNQNKNGRERKKIRANNEEEPEIVVLD